MVGSGPAGAAAAYYAARGGLSTILLDRKNFPRSKVCGDGLTPRALRALDRMGIGDVASGYPRIRGVRFVWKKDSRVLLYERETSCIDFGAVVPRSVLDDRIRRAAQEAGAAFRANTTVVDLRLDESGKVIGVVVDGVDGRYLIDAGVTIVADGASGCIGRRLRGDAPALSSPPAFAVRQYLVGVDGVEPYFEIHAPFVWRDRSLIGYAWVFPVTDGVANVGLGLLAQNRGLQGVTIADLFGEFLEDLIVRDPRFRAARPEGPVEGGALQTQMVNPFLTPPGVMLVGDAAGLVNTFTAEGIGYALESGELAGRTARQGLGRGRQSTVSYARQLVARYPRHWALREGPHHFRWLFSLGFDYLCGAASNSVLVALREFVLDEPVSHSVRYRIGSPVCDGTLRRLIALVCSRLLEELRETDPFVSELVQVLLRSPVSPALTPLLVSSAIMEPSGLHDPVVLDGLQAIASFCLAQSVLAEVDDGAGEQANGAAIILGDCLTTAATVALARLPDTSYRLVAEACRLAARAHASQANGSPRPLSVAEHYKTLAVPTTCAVDLVIRSAGSARLSSLQGEWTGFARWYGSTRAALHELRRDQDPRVGQYLRTQIADRWRQSAALNETVRSLCLVLCSEVCEALADLPPASSLVAAGE